MSPDIMTLKTGTKDLLLCNLKKTIHFNRYTCFNLIPISLFIIYLTTEYQSMNNAALRKRSGGFYI